MSGCVEGPTNCFILFYVMCVHVSTFYICIYIYTYISLHYITLHSLHYITYIHTCVCVCVKHRCVCVSVWRENCMKDFANIHTHFVLHTHCTYTPYFAFRCVYIYTHIHLGDLRRQVRIQYILHI